MSSKRKQAQESRNTAAVNAASALQLDKALGDVSSTSILVQGLFGKISEALVTKHAELKAVTDTIDLKIAELSELHGKDRILLSIDDLKVEFERKKVELEEELKTILRDREQEEQNYQYNINQAQKLANSQWDELVRVRERDHKIKMEELDKKAAEREAILALKEKEYQEAIARAATFDEAVKKEVDKQVSIVGNALKRDHSHQLEIINITNKAAIDQLTGDVSRLKSLLDAKDSTIATLQARLTAAQEAQTQLAKDAVTAAANQKALADMQSLFTNTGGQNGSRTKA